MPAPLDLEGARLGRLLVLGRGPAASARDAKCWRVRCDCGREEVYPQRRLTQDRPRRSAVRACSACEAPACLVCGAKLPGRGARRSTVCGEACRVARDREIHRGSYHRHAADPAWREATQRRSRERRRERMETDPAYAARERERGRARAARDAADPERMERKRLWHQRHYAANRDAIQERRKRRLDALDAAGLARWMERSRAYQRAYERRWRAGLTADPDAHRAYLDLMAEYRRRRKLSRLMADAGTLTEKLREHDRSDPARAR